MPKLFKSNQIARACRLKLSIFFFFFRISLEYFERNQFFRNTRKIAGEKCVIEVEAIQDNVGKWTCESDDDDYHVELIVLAGENYAPNQSPGQLSTWKSLLPNILLMSFEQIFRFIGGLLK